MIRAALLPLPGQIRGLFPGVLSALTVALAARFLSDHYGAPVMLMALLLGMAFGFLAEDTSRCRPGIDFAASRMLRFGVALLGLGITVQQVAAAGTAIPLLTLFAVCLTLGAGLALAWWSGKDIGFGLLSGGAVAICGASAALAIASVLPRSPTRERDTVFTVISVTALSTLAMIIYPVIATLLGLDGVRAGVFLGATIHDVAQVVGAGYSLSDITGDTATLVKLLRVSLLVPLVLGLAVAFGHRRSPAARGERFPFFVIGFAAMVLIGSYAPLPGILRDVLLDAARLLLIVAVAALGMKTSLGRLREVGAGAVGSVVLLTLLLASVVLGALLAGLI